MLYSRFFIPTIKNVFADNEARNYQILARGGFVRKAESGQYVVLPLGKRYFDRIFDHMKEPLVRKSGIETGRYEPETLMRAILSDLNSYKILPKIFYSRYTKNFDRRPRYGLAESSRSEMMGGVLIGTRGFVSACVGLDEALLQRLMMLGLKAGMAGRSSINMTEISDQTIYIKDENGSYDFFECEDCGMAFDVEAAIPRAEYDSCDIREKSKGILRMVKTPGVSTIQDLVKFFSANSSEFVKTMIYYVNEKPIAALIRGDRNISIQKLSRAMSSDNVRMATEDEIMEITGAEVGFAGPVGLEITIVADHEIMKMSSFIAGANDTDYHFANVTPCRDFQPDITADIRCATVEDVCHCGGAFREEKGFLVGTVEYIGADWFEKNGHFYTDDEGQRIPLEGSRCSIDLTAIGGLLAEACDNGKNPVFLQEIAPFDCVIIIANTKDDIQMDLALKMSRELKKTGLEPLIDDRDERIGVKFNDAEALGVPIRIVCGKRASEGIVEVTEAASGTLEMSYEAAIEMLSGLEEKSFGYEF